MNNNSVVCEMARAVAGDAWTTAAHVAQVTLCTTTVTAVAYALLNRKISKTAMHVNLKIIFTQMFVLYCIFCSPLIVSLPWTQIRYRTYTDACSLLFPPWTLVAVTGAPYHLLVLACPCWHLATTLERTYATYKAHCYEKISASYGVLSSVVVWFVSLIYAGYVVYLAVMDEGFPKPKATMRLMSAAAAPFVLRAHYAMIVVDLLTSFADFLLLRWNLRRLNSVLPSYSLSRSYQINENVLVTTRLVLPLSFSNTAFYVLYLVAASLARHVYSDVLDDPAPSPLLYMKIMRVYEWLIMPLMLQMLVSILIFLRFCKRRPKTVSIAKKSEEYDLYSQQFRQHW